MTKQPSVEKMMSKRMDFETQNELIHFDDHMNKKKKNDLNKNVAAFFADQQPRTRASPETKVLLGSSSLPALASAGSSPNNYRNGNTSPDASVDYGGRSLVDV